MRKRAITTGQSSINRFLSNIFLRPKKDGCFCPIMNSKNLNQFTPYSHIKMESLKQVKYLLQQNDLMVKLDLQDAYFSVPQFSKIQKYVRSQCVNL